MVFFIFDRDPEIKLEGHCIEKQIHNKLKKDSSRSDDLLSSYSCSKFQKCSFGKNAFKDKSRQSPNNNSGTAVKYRGFVTNEQPLFIRL